MSKTDKFVKFSYGVRALGVGLVLLGSTYSMVKDTGLIDKAVDSVNNMKQKINNKKVQKVMDRSAEIYKDDPVVKEAIKNTYYSECFRNHKAD